MDADRGNGRKSSRFQPSTSARGYGWTHQRLRARLEPVVRSGAAVCGRCGEPILPTERWDLDHDDDDRSRYLGASYRRCNRGRRTSKGFPLVWSRRWQARQSSTGYDVNLGDGLSATYFGHGIWETIPAGDVLD